VSPRRASLAIVLAAAGGLAAAVALAPEYLALRGFPLDAAWTRAVHARSLVESGALAYNPGVPAVDVPSPLWAVALAVPYALAPGTAAFVLAVKVIVSERDATRPAEVLGPLLVAVHPDLVAASMSGVEAPLASLTAAALLLALGRGSVLGYLAACAVAPLVRPELAALGLLLPAALIGPRDWRRLAGASTAAAGGTAVGCGAALVRTIAAARSAGSAPAAGWPALGDLVGAETAGFQRVFGRVAGVDSSILLAAGAVIALSVALGRPAPPRLARAAAAVLGGLGLAAAAFAVAPPVDASAFAQQWPALPAVALVLAGLPPLLWDALDRLARGRRTRIATAAALLALVALSVVVSARFRYGILSSDARNLDEVHVAIGRQLASASPADVVWAVEGGAMRYFGNAFVVELADTLGSPRARANGQGLLDRHPPRYIEAVAGWVDVRAQTPTRLEVLPFAPFSAYTLTSFPARQRHALVVCGDASVSGLLAFEGRSFSFRCAASPPQHARAE
jgi:hypothetical protein